MFPPRLAGSILIRAYGLLSGMTTHAATEPAYALPARANAALIAGIVAFHLLMLLALPFLLAHSLWWAMLIPALAFVHSTHWGLIHEGIHKLLNPDLATNERQSRLLGVLMGASFHVLRFGHLMHHKLNRDWHSEWVSERNLVNRVRYYGHLFFGLYGSEVLTSILVAVLPKERAIRLARRTALKHHPDVAIAGERFFYTRGHARLVRQDMAMSALLFAAAAWHFGAFWPFLLAFVAVRGLVISFMDNIYHYGTAEDNSKAGKELVLPAFYSRLLLHGNFHETHHLNPDVPWTRLPDCHNAQGRVFAGNFSEHGLLQFGGPLQSRTARSMPDSLIPSVL